jgi:hypothetical protein
VFELAKKPNEIDVRVVTDLMAMLPRPVSAPERDNAPDPRQVMWEIYKTMRERGELNLKPLAPSEVLEAKVAELEAEVERLTGSKTVPSSGRLTPIDPPTSDIVPPSERAECDAGVKPGPDDWRAQRSTTVIEGKANPPAAAAPAKPAWQDWLDTGGYGGPGYDRWADNRR